MTQNPIFAKAQFIKPDIPFDPKFRGENPAPMFRRTFWTDQTDGAVLSVCGLGYAYYYINGQPVSSDLFTAPVSNYEKTLWYLRYDVSALLQHGENVVAVICGNGWFNEEFRSAWSFEQAPWRDLPKCILQLDIGDQTVLVTDQSWKCAPFSAVTFNALRSGEYFDATRYDESWNQPGYDDSEWQYAAVDQNPPRGVFRECRCEPVREHEIYPAKLLKQTAADRFVFDIGQNISGYIRLSVVGNKGQELTIRYCECLHPDGTPDFDGVSRFFPDSPIQTDRFICSGKAFCWYPRFVYHGFRYLEITGLHQADEISVSGVFVHQAIRSRTSFSCSDNFLNQLFKAGQISTLSNFFYLVSDCPTREKLGWLNDAQMSCEQILTNFHAEKLLRKWMVDLRDAQREDGAIPCIVPTSGWGYGWGSGPLSDGALFEIPYRLWLHTGDGSELIRTLPYFERYLAYLRTKETADGQILTGLGDWATAGERADVPVSFVNDVLAWKFEKIAAIAADLAGRFEKREQHLAYADWRREQILHRWVNTDGRASIEQMTLPAVLLVCGIWKDRSVLERQLIELVEKSGCHHNCGVLGLRCLYEALALCGRADLAYRVITAVGYPSYRSWFESGGTTLYEHWRSELQNHDYISKNHHMYSDVLSFLVKNTLGIWHDMRDPQEPEFHLKPYFWGKLSFATGRYQTDHGTLSVDWKRQKGEIAFQITLTGTVMAEYQGQILEPGTHLFHIPENREGKNENC